MEMARDAIGIVGIDMEDDGESLPLPSLLADVQKNSTGGIVPLLMLILQNTGVKTTCALKGQIAQYRYG